MNTKVWQYLQRAREDVAFAEEVLRMPSFADRATRYGYFAMCHAAQALLLALGVAMKSQAGIRAAFAKHFALSGKLNWKFYRYLAAALESRLKQDYDVSFKSTAEMAQEVVNQAREFVSAAEDYLNNLPKTEAAV